MFIIRTLLDDPLMLSLRELLYVLVVLLAAMTSGSCWTMMRGIFLFWSYFYHFYLFWSFRIPFECTKLNNEPFLHKNQPFLMFYLNFSFKIIKWKALSLNLVVYKLFFIVLILFHFLRHTYLFDNRFSSPFRYRRNNNRDQRQYNNGGENYSRPPREYPPRDDRDYHHQEDNRRVQNGLFNTWHLMLICCLSLDRDSRDYGHQQQQQRHWNAPDNVNDYSAENFGYRDFSNSRG